VRQESRNRQAGNESAQQGACPFPPYERVLHPLHDQHGIPSDGAARAKPRPTRSSSSMRDVGTANSRSICCTWGSCRSIPGRNSPIPASSCGSVKLAWRSGRTLRRNHRRSGQAAENQPPRTSRTEPARLCPHSAHRVQPGQPTPRPLNTPGSATGCAFRSSAGRSVRLRPTSHPNVFTQAKHVGSEPWHQWRAGGPASPGEACSTGRSSAGVPESMDQKRGRSTSGR